MSETQKTEKPPIKPENAEPQNVKPEKSSPEKGKPEKSELETLKEDNVRLKTKIRNLCAIMADTGFNLQLVSKQLFEK